MRFTVIYEARLYRVGYEHGMQRKCLGFGRWTLTLDIKL